jgi:hypothetical protein
MAFGWTIISVLALIIVIVTGATLRTAWHSNGPGKYYWTACGILIGGGMIGLVAVLVAPPQHFDEAGRLIGEMPPEFGLFFKLLQAGTAAAVLGFLALGAKRLVRTSRSRR